ncbi:hypothetical protein BH11PLA1_BH11PLA1_21940 [soil metagenome]
MRDAAPAAPGAPAARIDPIDRLAELRAKKAVLLRIIRMAFITMLMTVTLLFILKLDASQAAPGDSAFSVAQWWFVPLTVSIVLSIGVILLDEFTPKKISTFSGLFFGLLAGLLATYALAHIIDLLGEVYDITTRANPEGQKMMFAVKVLIGICFCYLGVATVLGTQDDFRLVIPYVEFAKQLRGPKPLLLDSSALIDGRIVELCGTGFIQVPLIVPRFVIAELQGLADHGDRAVRTRGRRGLDAVARLQRLRGVDTIIDETPIPGTVVDQRLVELATALPATIVTTDSGLDRVAKIHGVGVLSLADLAGALRPSLIPGNRVTLTLVKVGEQPHQGVGYLDDGTMVVVDDGNAMIGREVNADVVSSLQTSGGRLIFARLERERATEDAGTRERLPLGFTRAEEPDFANGARDDGAPHESIATPGAESNADADEETTPREPGAEHFLDQSKPAPGLPPTTVAPPAAVTPPPRSPFPPTRGVRNPLRNPRR